MTPAEITPQMARLMSEADRKALGVVLPEQAHARADAKNEAALQRLCELELSRRGFRPRTPSEILRPGLGAGWYIHLHVTKQNPLLLDLLILHANGTWQEIELKTATGKTTSEQDALIGRGGHLCRTFDAFVKILNQAGATHV